MNHLHIRLTSFIPIFLVFLLSCSERSKKETSVIVRSEFIFKQAPFPSAHASTIVETGNTILAAWFGGTAEGNPDVGIWLSRYDCTYWSAPVEAANGVQPDGKRYPCWNPVLFQPSGGPLLLFYKVGPNPREWRGRVQTSTDYGHSWSAAVPLPEGFLGPIRAKPVELPDGTLIAGSSTEHAGWVVHMERFHGPVTDAVNSEMGRWKTESLSSAGAWQKTGPLNDPEEFGAIQPAILVHTAERLQILCRSRQGVITEAWSEDGGHTWGKMSATPLPNPNSGIDVTKLVDGRFLLAYNPTSKGRDKLALAVSRDGIMWRNVAVLENSPGEYSYPAQIQSDDGMVHITYTWKRQRIKHVVVDPSRIE
jgi:predicted neuraminidase